MMELKDRLKSARLDKKMSQKDVCELADVAKSTYSQYESGDREPSREALIRLSKALGTSVDWLLDVPEDMPFECPKIRHFQEFTRVFIRLS